MWTKMLIGLLWATPLLAAEHFHGVPFAGRGELRDHLSDQPAEWLRSTKGHAALIDLGMPYVVTVADDPVALESLEIGRDVTLRIVRQLAMTGASHAVIDNAGRLVIDADALSGGITLERTTHLIGHGMTRIERGGISAMRGGGLIIYPAQRVELNGLLSGQITNHAVVEIGHEQAGALIDSELQNSGRLEVDGSLVIQNTRLIQDGGELAIGALAEVEFQDGSSILGGTIHSSGGTISIAPGAQVELAGTDIQEGVSIGLSADARLSIGSGGRFDGELLIGSATLVVGSQLEGTGTIWGGLETGRASIASGERGYSMIGSGLSMAGSFEVQDDLVLAGKLDPQADASGYGLMRFGGALVLRPSAEVVIDVSADRRDLIDIAGSLQVTPGATLVVRLNGERVQPGTVMTLIKADAIDGDFDGVRIETDAADRLQVRSTDGRVDVTFGYCPADTNENGELDAGDFGAWLRAFSDQDPIGDQNSDGRFDDRDYAAWLSNFERGCE